VKSPIAASLMNRTAINPEIPDTSCEPVIQLRTCHRCVRSITSSATHLRFSEQIRRCQARESARWTTMLLRFQCISIA